MDSVILHLRTVLLLLLLHCLHCTVIQLFIAASVRNKLIHSTFCESRPTGSSSIMHTKTQKKTCDLDL